MKLTSVVAAILGLGLVSNVHGGVKELKVVNGVRLVRVKTMGIFCPSTTTICYYPTNTPGVLYTVNSADSSGVLGQVAGAAGQATSGALVRPARTSVNQGGGRIEGFIEGPQTTINNGPANNNNAGGNPDHGNPHNN